MSALIQNYYFVEAMSTITTQNSFYMMVIDYSDHIGKCTFANNYIGFLDILYVMINIEGNLH